MYEVLDLESAVEEPHGGGALQRATACHGPGWLSRRPPPAHSCVLRLEGGRGEWLGGQKGKGLGGKGGGSTTRAIPFFFDPVHSVRNVH